ncbi:MAG: bifunctional phosphopantothenoylcysteine decarboxylase/phosphopantothenate--cysteine ligase CoaBC [Candidatus Thorarchaeota archaeon]|nr:MAG: bifunctional phosphopantothenoylcysteine decarboxylase/phosphopantothenate--cysteine ligase CoaBC [Candidatus Thorarchaeota archaeon]
MEHTSKLIKGSLSDSLNGKSIALCITGSVGAVECVALARKLMRHGAEVYTVMSNMAQKIIHPYLMEWATGNTVTTELTGQIEHVALAGKHKDHVDLVMIAPATANTIGKVANGIDDTPVTTTVSSAIGAGIPLIVVPAMHESMYDHPAVIENIEKLRGMGVIIVSPRLEEAKAKIPSIKTIVDHVLATLGPKDLEGTRFVVTAGPTRGWIDRVRFITNPSTGKMGIAVAQELLSGGANVSLIVGPISETVPEQTDVKRVTTSQEMLESVLSELSKHKIDGFVATAAVLDYEPSKKEDSKMPSGVEDLSVKLVPTIKIIEEARKKQKDLFIVGFKVESGVSDKELDTRAREKIKTGICDLVVANDEQKKGVAFGTDTNEVLIVAGKSFAKHVLLAPKREIARQIVDVIVEQMK